MEITSDKRIRASLPTIQYALAREPASFWLRTWAAQRAMPNPDMSLKPVAVRLQELLGRPSKWRPIGVGPEVEAMKPAPGEVLLLENLRFHLEEQKNDPEFAKKLAALCDVYVNDAFGTAHRAHASTVGMVQFVPEAAAGLLMDNELKYLGMATTTRPGPASRFWRGQSVGQDRKSSRTWAGSWTGCSSAAPWRTPSSRRKACPQASRWWRKTRSSWPASC